ncbi:hypothetical protein [Paraburkholderia phosphatilytica]|uniref:hypothetical protein n=1 Tax=Paraburkholderia phosphatilytica TaxID=2282883 RepID=UPI000F5E8B75|nr:hypothetical protein [Paraburkholderia phosphatilytica]
MFATRRGFTALLCAGAACGTFALWRFDVASTLRTWQGSQHQTAYPVRDRREARGFFERVDFVLETASQPKADDAQKKRKTQERRAAAPKVASGGSTSAHGPVQSGQPAPSDAQHPSKDTATPPAMQDAQQGKRAAVAEGASTSPAQLQPPSASAPAQAIPGPTASINRENPAAPLHPPGSSLPRLTRAELLNLLPGAAVSRISLSGDYRRWTNKPDGTLTAYWMRGDPFKRLRAANGRWSISADGRFCLHIDWDGDIEDWCRFLTRMPNGKYQPIADNAGTSWTPPQGEDEWRPMEIKR